MWVFRQWSWRAKTCLSLWLACWVNEPPFAEAAHVVERVLACVPEDWGGNSVLTPSLLLPKPWTRPFTLGSSVSYLKWIRLYGLQRHLLAKFSSEKGQSFDTDIDRPVSRILFNQGSTNFSCKGPGGEYIKLHGPYSPCCKHSTLE